MTTAPDMVAILDRRLLEEPDTAIKLVFHKHTFYDMKAEWADRFTAPSYEHRDYMGNLNAHGRVYEVWTAPGQERYRVAFRRKLSESTLL